MKKRLRQKGKPLPLIIQRPPHFYERAPDGELIEITDVDEVCRLGRILLAREANDEGDGPAIRAEEERKRAEKKA